MTIYYLYVKTHTATGLKYLGYTSKKDPHKYPGSGLRWLKHLKEHGFSYTTDIIACCDDMDSVRALGIHYSMLWDIVKDRSWANLKPESGQGGIMVGELNGMFQKTHTEQVKSRLRDLASKRFRGKTYLELYGEEKAMTLRNLRSASMQGRDNSHTKNPRFDSTEYTFYNHKTGEMLICTRWVFYTITGISRPSVSSMVNDLIWCKNWCVLY